MLELYCASRKWTPTLPVVLLALVWVAPAAPPRISVQVQRLIVAIKNMATPDACRLALKYAGKGSSPNIRLLDARTLARA